jgi:hypothetical protein
MMRRVPSRPPFCLRGDFGLSAGAFQTLDSIDRSQIRAAAVLMKAKKAAPGLSQLHSAPEKKGS